MERLTNEEIEAIRKRAEMATEGPWAFTTCIEDDTYVLITADFEELLAEEIFEWKDAEFIANARTDISKLLAEIDRLKEENRVIIESIFGDAMRRSAESNVKSIREKIAEAKAND